MKKLNRKLLIESHEELKPYADSLLKSNISDFSAWTHFKNIEGSVDFYIKDIKFKQIEKLYNFMNEDNLIWNKNIVKLIKANGKIEECDINDNWNNKDKVVFSTIKKEFINVSLTIETYKVDNKKISIFYDNTQIKGWYIERVEIKEINN